MSRKPIDLTGMRFHRWFVIEYDGPCRGPGKNMAYWKCLCSCGSIRSVNGASLRGGTSKSCGCYGVEINGKWAIKRSISDQVAHDHMQSYIRGAKSRGIDFSLTDDEFSNLIILPCHYCGAKPSERPSTRKSAPVSGYFANGIDRKSSNGPYRMDNCVPCCGRCNISKMNLTYQEFIDMCKKVSGLHSNIGE